jgi:hypothetical protein
MQLVTRLSSVRSPAAVFLGAALCVSAMTPVAADDSLVVQLPPLRDNTLYEDSGSLSNGAGQFLFAGKTHTEMRRRCLLEFDVSSIPAAAVILDARVDVHVSNSVSGDVPMTLHRVLAVWGEAGSNAGDPGGLGAPSQPGDATGSHAFTPGTSWASAGGDFAAPASATEPIGFVGSYAWQAAGLVADVQDWVSGASPNHGWIVLGAEGTTGSAKRFDSRDHVDPAARPVLTVTYRAPVSVDAMSWGEQKAAYR